ncbi:hypothetical protein GCM10010982_03950 [Bowmanella pacifica]|uniref:DUF3019 domain-containing protein n=1 Tax=Bowmanella pacifica TaxID=502051 RepID=A0A917YU99_9ALTE|nr:hypothetical protein GCM10010982_03950 [Bowmanella pacifica]
MLLLGFATNANQAPAQLLVSPDTCVTINKGRTCYTQVSIEWHLPQTGDYCLFLAGLSEPLACWQNRQQGNWQFEFSSSTSTTLLLKQGNEVLLSQEIQVNWVYESQRRKRNWRLF